MRLPTARPVTAAVYARKSSDHAEGVERQVELAQDFARAKGWGLGPVFSDNDVSGGTFDRPGLNALLAALEAPGREWDALVVMESSRLGREQAQTLTLQLRITGAGVRVFHYQDGSELKVDTPTAKLVASVNNFAAEDYRHQIKLKTRAALQKKAEQGHAIGRSPYGAKLEDRGTHKVHVLDPETAPVVARIFQAVAEGQGLRRIAEALNVDPTTPAPGGRWGVSSLQNLLRRPLYRKLGVVSEALWLQAHKAMDSTRERFAARRDAKGHLSGRAEAGLVSRHLLSGFLACSCGAAMRPIVHAKPGKPVHRYWGCSRHAKSGKSACSNSRLVPYEDITQSILSHFTRATLEAALLSQPAPEPALLDSERVRVAAELARTDKLVGNLTDAIGVGGDLPSLVAKLQAATKLQESLRAKLTALETNAQEETEETIREALADSEWQPWTLTGSPEDRAILRALIPGKVTVTPTESGWSYSGAGNLLGSLSVPSGRLGERAG